MAGDLYITGDAATDRMLNTDGFALLVGMLLDQQVPMEWAFAGPATLQRRLPRFDPAHIASMDEDEFVAICCDKPAIHRFPASLGRRIHAVCGVVANEYHGDTAAIWSDVDADELARRLRELPGFGEEKTKIFVALLAKRQGVRPLGWQRVAAPFSDETPRSIADCHDEASLAMVREWKKTQKAARRDKQDRPLGQS
jgi:uncharacterized HhH-GPD family protein